MSARIPAPDGHHEDLHVLTTWMKWLRDRPGASASWSPGGGALEPSAQQTVAALDWNSSADLFAIVSWGCAATVWLGRALTAVPEVLCLHHVRLYIESATKAKLPENDLDYFKFLLNLGSGYKLVGDIHGLPRRLVPVLRADLGERFRAAVVVRSPGPRLLSQLRLFEDNNYEGSEWNGLDRLATKDGYARIAHHITDRKRLLFAHAADLLNEIVEEWALTRIFRCEDLTTSPRAFQALVEHLSGGKVAVPHDLAARIVTAPPINAHGRSGRILTISEGWQREILHALVRPEAMSLYAQLGYEMPDWWLSR